MTKRLLKPTLMLKMMDIDEIIEAPNDQREVMNTLIRRIQNSSKMRFACKKFTEHFEITRTK